jgi:hypothetical protein
MPRIKKPEPLDKSAGSLAGSRRSINKKRGATQPRTVSTPEPPAAEAVSDQTSAATPDLATAEQATDHETSPSLTPNLVVDTSNMTAVASTVTLAPGLSLVEITIPPVQPYALGQVSLPLIWLSQPAVNETDRLKILTASGGDDNWLPPPGDLIVVRSPASGGQLTVTVFGPPGQQMQAASIAVRRLNRAEVTAPIVPATARVAREREIPFEVLAHIERRGDQVFSSSGWIGTRGSRLRIEGFLVRPFDGLAAADLEYRIQGPDGGEAPWTSSPQFCGTRGRRQRLTGFAVRVTPHLQDRITVEYFGAFYDSGISGPFKNGEPCRPLLPGDTLEAMNIRLIQHG